jgi:hypothetical protein
LPCLSSGLDCPVPGAGLPDAVALQTLPNDAPEMP